MIQDNNTELITKEKTNDVDLKFIVGKALGNWYWFVISVIVWVILGVVFYLVVTPQFNVAAKVMVTGPNPRLPSGSSDENAILFDNNASNTVANYSNVNNELQVLHSRTHIMQTVYDMQLNVTYWQKVGLVYRETYKRSPFFIKLLELKAGQVYMLYDPQQYYIKIHKNKLSFEDLNTDSTFTAHFGDTLRFRYGSWVLLKNPDIPADSTADYELKVGSYGMAFTNYNANIIAILSTTGVTTIDLTLPSGVKDKGEDILRHLINLYIQSDIDHNNKIADSTIAFIDERLKHVAQDLNNIESNIETFKKNNNIADLSEQGKVLLTTNVETNRALDEQQVQINVVKDLENYLEDGSNNKRIMPTTAPIKDPAFVSLLEKYNSLQLERQKMLVTSTENNPAIQTLDTQTAQLREDLLRLLKSYEQGLIVSKNDLSRQTGNLYNNIQKVPTQEKIYLEYARKQNVLQSLYTYLLQTREQTAVSKSDNISPIRIVDQPMSDPIPYFPNLIIVMLAALLLGLLCPAGTIFVKELLNTKVLTPDDVQEYTNVPVVARIEHIKSKNPLVVTMDARTAVAEQFRTLRTNLQYLLTGVNEKVILVTSSMGNEGKSFVAINFASALALSGKKVLLLEMDFRKPKLSANLKLSDQVGVTDYIISDLKLMDIAKPSGIHGNWWIASSGNIPPNPSELMAHARVQQLFTEAKHQFDYIVVDTPPVGLVTDAQLISRYADMSLYVVRQKFTNKRQLSIIEELAVTHKMPKLNIILNDMKKIPGYSYGTSKHEAAYYKDKKPFFKRIFRMA
jgi:tyrosine-protein kinase Etk/Wzc